MLAGAIDKVGILPLAATWLFAGAKFLEDKNIPANYLEITVCGLGLFYLFGIVSMAATYRLDELAHTVESALLTDQIQNVQSATAGGQSGAGSAQGRTLKHRPRT